MIRDITGAPPTEVDFLITVRCSIYEYPIRLWVSPENTIDELKQFLGVKLERFMDEMTLLVNRSYPYPLAGAMRLDALLVEHRHLLLMVHEGGKGIGSAEEDVWWSQDVPERYLGQTVEGAVLLDLRYLAKESIRRIRSWLYQEREIEEIWLLGTHPCVMDILYAVAEDVLSLPRLRRVVIDSPHRVDYLEPIKSRQRSLEQGALEQGALQQGALEQRGVSHLRRNGLVYLYQHLQLDQYRASEDVEIWVAGGLLPGVEAMTRFLLE